ncbi:MAG TPA: spermidine synthase [Casimicrobiaceae bacterium]|nr:spermidine synthase [Casimicrobiaceae bacterium]
MLNDTLALSGDTLGARKLPRDYRLAFLSAIFVVSGFCGLIYESIWSHYLKLFVGHAAYAQTVVLVVFIGGMALGAALVGRVAQKIRSPLVAYAGVEAAVGAISLVFHGLFVSVTEWSYSALLPAMCVAEAPCVAQWAVAAALILPQSILLGTTFPLMTAGVLRLAPVNPGSKIASFYFLNSIGAVAGVLASAFILIPAMGLPGSLLTAGLLNIAVAIGAYACSKGTQYEGLTSGTETVSDSSTFRRMMLVVAALTGLSSFIYEIAWIRMLSLVIGASTDAFELMLAAFILGLALGGLWVRTRIDRFKDLIATLAIVQVLMGVAAVLTLPVYDKTFDVLAWLIQSLNRTENGYVVYNVLSHGLALVVMLPATFLAGMTLPLITTALLRGAQGERAIGFVYAANTFGAIVGVIIAVHFALPLLGLKGALLLGAAIDIGLAFALLRNQRTNRSGGLAQALAFAGVAVLLAVAALVPIVPERMASGVYRHGVARLLDEFKIVYHNVGKTANIAVIRSEDATSIRTNGKSDASIAYDPSKPSPDEYTMALTAIVPLVYRPNVENAAVIGFGSGMTTATLLGSPLLKRVDTIEIEPAMVEGARLFGAPVEAAYVDPRSRIIIDDAKSYFARSALRYDLIVSEPSNPWVSGVASLFTAEFYQRVKRQLTDGGIFVQWIQTYEFSNALLGTIMRAMDDEFADYAVYTSNGGDMILVASNKKLPAPDVAFTRFERLRPTLDRLQMGSLDEIEARRLTGALGVRAWLNRTAPRANSDFYPLVDLGAPRARFIGGQALAFIQIPMSPLPVIEMLERRTELVPVSIGPGKAQVERREAIHTAQVSAAWLLSGRHDETKVPLPRDLGLLRSHLWHCSALPPNVTASAMLRDVAAYANPFLSKTEATEFWAGVRAAPCLRMLTPQDLEWLALFEAAGARHARKMAEQGQRLLTTVKQMRPEMRGYAIIASATGLLAMGDAKGASSLLERELAKLPKNAQEEPMFNLLRGFAAMNKQA